MMGRLTYKGQNGKNYVKDNGYYNGVRLSLDKTADRLAAYEDTGLEPEEIGERETLYNEILTRTYGPMKQKISEWLKSEKSGSLVVLPFPLGKTLIDCSDPERPELLRNFRVALAYDRCGIVFHQPLNIFLENVQKGYIREVSEEAEAVLRGGGV